MSPQPLMAMSKKEAKNVSHPHIILQNLDNPYSGTTFEFFPFFTILSSGSQKVKIIMHIELLFVPIVYPSYRF